MDGDGGPSAPEPHGGSDAAPARAPRSTSRPARVAALAGLVALALVVATTAVVLTRHPNHADGHPIVAFGPLPAVAPTTAAALAGGTWASIPVPPLTAVYAAAWTGHEVLAIGSTDSPGDESGRPTLHLAAFQPATAGWVQLGTLPGGDGQLDHATWTGRRLLVWRTSPGTTTTSAGEAYDPTTATWTHLAAPPAVLGNLTGAAFWWTGRDLLVVNTQPAGGHPGSDEVWPSGAVYDPVADRWRTLPPAPAHRGRRIVYSYPVWAGDRLEEWWEWDDATSATNPGLRVSTGISQVSYEPSRNRWSVPVDLPDPPRAPFGLLGAMWTGNQVFLPPARQFISFGLVAIAGDPADPLGPGYTYQPNQGRYHVVASGPIDAEVDTSRSIGGVPVLFGSYEGPGQGSDSARAAAEVWDAYTNRWATLPPPGLHLFAATVWTGHQLIAFDETRPVTRSGQTTWLPTSAMALTPRGAGR